MKRIWLYFGICSLLACSLPARAGIAPDVLARSTTEEVVHIVTQDAAIKNGNTKKVDALVETVRAVQRLPVEDARSIA